MIGSIYIDDKKDYWINYEYLIFKGIPQGTLNNWITRNTCERIYLEGRAYIAYDTIPEPSRAKLPTKEEIRAEYYYSQFEELEEDIYKELAYAYECINICKWRREILEKYPVFTIEQAVVFARLASVLEYCLNLRKELPPTGKLAPLYKAFSRIYPDKYNTKNRFCMALKQATEKGILSVAVNHHKLCSGRKKAYAAEHEYYAAHILNHNKAFSIPVCYEFFRKGCSGRNLPVPCFTWFRNYWRKNKNIFDRGRLGVAKSGDMNRTYAKIIPALYSGDQWQIDGWEIPLFYKKPNGKGGVECGCKATLFTVLDARSRRIIGFHVGESENTEVILKGLENAIKSTGHVPFEIVSDNHSFNKTKEARSLKGELKNMGVTWNVDSNPRRKAILERAFRTLGENHYKKRFGYIGAGVKSRSKYALTQQELRDIYLKPENNLTFDQVIATTICVIDEYNNSIIKSLKDTPNNLYNKSEKPNAIPVDEFKRLSLFIRKSESKVIHGQITIKRGGSTYEYQLPAEYSERYNNQTVSVRYSDFNHIYLYETDTDQPICCIHQKFAIHGAQANQTEQDKDFLFKNKGRIKGIETKGRKKKTKLFDEVNSINPDAYDYINRVTAPKDVLKELAEKKTLRDHMIDEYDLNPGMLRSFPAVNEMLDTSLKPQKKDIRSPYYDGKGSMKKIIINEEGTPPM